MIRKLLLMTLLIGLLATGCGTAQQDDAAFHQTETSIALVVSNQLTAAAPQPSATPEAVVVEKHAITAGELSVGSQLLVGILKMEGTDLAITKEQAMALYPLWANLQVLLAQQTPSQPGGGGPGEQQTQATPSSADTESLKQITGIIQQIQDVLTAEQVNQIVSYHLTQNDVTALMEANQISTATPSAMQAGGMGGGMGGGTPPDGGAGGAPGSGDASGGAPPDGGTPPDMSSTPQAGQQMAQGERIQTELLDYLLKFLQTRGQ